MLKKSISLLCPQDLAGSMKLYSLNGETFYGKIFLFPGYLFYLICLESPQVCIPEREEEYSKENILIITIIITFNVKPNNLK